MPSDNIYRLKILGLPALKNIQDLASEVRLSEDKMKYLAYRTEHLYIPVIIEDA
ncbi:hypothetical protein [Vibrio sp. 1180_3]|uniref:hypothetical protein n=1 Tax=Vibrio sp. 1180_3 TaxID=2528832 RepID=UPI0024074F4A|nr:hypothetical protein [Vibrio sp. 1180_3]